MSEPNDIREALMEGAWHDFVLWAHDQPEMRRAFEQATGNRFPCQTASVIERAIDEATGANVSAAAAFVEWVTRNHWGLESAPKKYQEALASAPARLISR